MKMEAMRASFLLGACVLAGCIDFGSLGSDLVDGPGGSSGIGGSGGTFPNNPPPISVLDSHPILGESSAEVVVVLSWGWHESISVQLVTLDGTAKGDATGAGDYQPVSQVVSFPAGATSAQISIPVKSPYTSLTLDTSLSKEFAVVLSSPTGGSTIADGEGRVTLAQAGMVIETPLATALSDGDVIPDFNGDKKADLLLTGDSGRGAILVTPGTAFQESSAIALDADHVAGNGAFSYEVGAPQIYGGFVTGGRTMPSDFDQDGISDVLTVVDGKYRILYGHKEPFPELDAGAPELSDGTHATEIADLATSGNISAIQTGDWDGDGLLDWAQAHWYSTASGGANAFQGYYAAPGPHPGVIPDAVAFSFTSGVPAVGQSSQAHGTSPGVRADLNGDGRSDLVFIGNSANDTQFGGELMYVKFGSAERWTETGAAIRDTLDGSNGFQLSNPVQPSSRIGIHDAGDVNGDAIDDLVLQGAGKGLSILFGKKTPFGTGSFASIDEFADGAISFPDSAKSARVGDVNHDGIGDLVLLTADALVIVWGKPGFSVQDLAVTSYPDVGRMALDPNSNFNGVLTVADLDGDGAAEILLASSSWGGGTGGALVLFGKTLTRALGGPNFDRAPPR
jgi:hypothetical protein